MTTGAAVLVSVLLFYAAAVLETFYLHARWVWPVFALAMWCLWVA